MKELKDYIHLYIGCKVEIIGGLDVYGTTKGILTGIHGEYGPEVQVIFNNHADETPEYPGAENIKLILRPLSDLTSKEQDELWHADEPLGVISMYNGDNNRKIVLAPERMAYLLSKGFDLFGLKEAGLSIYE